MATLEVEIGAELLKVAKNLALRHYGDDGDAAVSRVVEAALMMRILWLHLAEVSGREVGEPLASWEFGDAKDYDQLQEELNDLLLKRR